MPILAVLLNQETLRIALESSHEYSGSSSLRIKATVSSVGDECYIFIIFISPFLTLQYPV